MSKRTLIALISCLVVLFSTPYRATATPVTDLDFEYEIIGEEVKISKYIGTAADVEIPQEFEGKPVFLIGANAFYELTHVTNVHIPEGVSQIGESAFYGCSGLTSIKLPDSVISIGTRAFWRCSALVNIDLPDGLKRIGQMVFADCTSLENLSLPASLSMLPHSSFRRCTNLESIHVPRSVLVIRSNALLENPSMTIYGAANSKAQEYAEANGLLFAICTECCDVDPYEVYAEDLITLIIGSAEVTQGSRKLTEPLVLPQIINGRTMLPFRYLIETVLGGTVDYVTDTRTIKATINGYEITMEVDSPEYHIIGDLDDEYASFTSQAPVIVEDYTLVPLRAFESLVSAIGWDGEAQKVTIIPYFGFPYFSLPY